MNSLSKTNIATVFKILTLSFLLFSSNIVKAQVIEFECDNAKFNVDISGSQVIRPGMEITSIDWQFDGEWMRWKTKPNDEGFGINIKNGYLITTSSTSQQNCKILSQYDLRKIPISKGAVLRKNFVEFSDENRKYAQECLRGLGYYNSTIDGLWGRGTELAVMQFYEDRKSSEFLNKNVKIEDDAYSIILSLLDKTRDCDLQSGACDECEEGEEGLDLIEPDLDEAKKLWDSGQRDEAARMWEAGMMLGMTRAINNIGFLHRDGLAGYSQDYMLAAKYYRKAAEGGYHYSMWSLGELFRRNKLPEIGGNEAYHFWHKKFFETVTEKYGFDPKKYDESQTDLIVKIASLFDYGSVIPHDEEKAYQWYSVAASRGHEYSIERTGVLVKYAPVAPISESNINNYKAKCNGYSTILGLCWALSSSEMKAVIQSRNFKRVDNHLLSYQKDSGGGTITLSGNTMSFDCSLFNTCPLTPREIAEKLMSAGLVVGDMENTSTTSMGMFFETYCGRGVKGEKICVQAGKKIEMSKGVVGKDVSFN